MIIIVIQSIMKQACVITTLTEYYIEHHETSLYYNHFDRVKQASIITIVKTKYGELGMH